MTRALSHGVVWFRAGWLLLTAGQAVIGPPRPDGALVGASAAGSELLCTARGAACRP